MVPVNAMTFLSETPLRASTALQEHTGFDVVGVRKLIEQRTPNHSMGLVQGFEVRAERCWVARDVKDAIEPLHHRAPVGIQSGSGRVDEHRAEPVIGEIDTRPLQPAKRPNTGDRIGNFGGREPHHGEVRDAVCSDVVLRGLN